MGGVAMETQPQPMVSNMQTISAPCGTSSQKQIGEISVMHHSSKMVVSKKWGIPPTPDMDKKWGDCDIQLLEFRVMW